MPELPTQLAMDIAQHHRTPMSPHPWFLEIPRLVLSSYHWRPVTASMRAVVLLFRFAARDRELESRACQFYRGAVQAQQQLIGFLESGRIARIGHLEHCLSTLVLTMLLLEFEMMRPCIGSSWCHQSKKAARVLEVLGPERCMGSPFHEIFLLLRHMMAYVSLLDDSPSYLGSTAWLQISFRYHAKISHDVLIDHLLAIPHARQWRRQPGDVQPAHRESTINLGISEALEDSLTLSQAKTILGRSRPEAMSNSGIDVALMAAGILYSVGQLALHYPLVTTTSSQTSILESRPSRTPDDEEITPPMAQKHCPGNSSGSCETDQGTTASSFILATARLFVFADIVENITFSVTCQLMFAVDLVSRYSPVLTDRIEAREMFSRWQQSLGFVAQTGSLTRVSSSDRGPL